MYLVAHKSLLLFLGKQLSVLAAFHPLGKSNRRADLHQDSIIEVPRPELSERTSHILPPALDLYEVQSLVEEYLVATTGLVDLFEKGELTSNLQAWINNATSTSEVVSATYFLVLAIGIQEKDESKAELWFKRARDDLLINLCGSMNVATVQGFALVSLYMLRAFQPNGAYLYFCRITRCVELDSC